ncbi:hypothetical protein G6F68_021846 [Rhizopus microsporus]|nr:hypothetical protein G6F68_021846 [Rhizopus microsporus]
MAGAAYPERSRLDGTQSDRPQLPDPQPQPDPHAGRHGRTRPDQARALQRRPAAPGNIFDPQKQSAHRPQAPAGGCEVP